MGRGWVEGELGGVELGDKRLNRRLMDIAEAFESNPQASIPQATVSWERTKGAYRFFDNPKVTPEKLLKPHRESSSKRVKEYAQTGVVFAIQDTTEVDYASHPSAELGYGRKPRSNSLFFHPTLVCSDKGIPLGVIHQQIWIRKERGTKLLRTKKPTAEKESGKWLKGHDAAVEFQKQHPEMHVISICDREGDLYDLFAQAVRAKVSSRTDLLVRSAQDRLLENETQKLKGFIQAQEEKGAYSLTIPRNGKRKERTVSLSVRFCEVSIKPPKSRETESLESLNIWVVEAREAAKEGISWRLLTTHRVVTSDEAIEVLRWYSQRWIIEEYFKVLKSGCQIEERQLQTFERLENCLTLDAIIAWRILFLLYSGREMPDLPALILFSEIECNALYGYSHKTPKPPPKPLLLSEMTMFLAKLGGFLGRKGDGLPGATVLWRGSWRLPDIVATWSIFNPQF